MTVGIVTPDVVTPAAFVFFVFVAPPLGFLGFFGLTGFVLSSPLTSPDFVKLLP